MVDPERQRHRVTRIIAATRFPFIDQEEWSWPPSYQTIFNDEQKRFGLKGPYDVGIIYPSIVILRGDGGVQELGMVEPAGNVIQERAKVWQFLSDSASRVETKKLFVYVPHGLEDKALDILEGNDVEYDGLRGYAVVDGNLKVSPYKSHSSTDHR